MREDFYSEYFRIEDRHWWFVGRRKILLAVLDECLPPVPGRARDILDFGCGTGTMLGHLRRFGDVAGVDADPRAVAFCRERGEQRVSLVETGTLPYEDDSLDLVTMLDVLEHLDDDRGALREVQRVLRPGGTFLATVPAYPWMWGPQDEINHHRRRYRTREFGERIGEAGLRQERLTHFNTILFPPIAAVRLARRVVPEKGPAKSDFEMTGPGRLNGALGALFGAEAALVRRRDLPFGVSILALAVNPAA